jgi:hypothetical protein
MAALWQCPHQRSFGNFRLFAARPNPFGAPALPLVPVHLHVHRLVRRRWTAFLHLVLSPLALAFFVLDPPLDIRVDSPSDQFGLTVYCITAIALFIYSRAGGFTRQIVKSSLEQGPLREMPRRIDGIEVQLAKSTAQVEKAEQRLTVQFRVSQILTGCDCIKDAARPVLQAICETLGGNRSRGCASTGLPLGVDLSSEFPASSEVALELGDLIVLYTDGIVETFSPEGNLFTSERLLASIRQHRERSPDEILDALFHAATDHAQGAD